MVQQIKALSKEKGLSIKELEKTLGFGEGTIYKWETSSPKVENLNKVATYLGVSIDYLLGTPSPALSLESIPLAFHDDGHEVSEEELENAMKIIRRYQEQQEKKK